MTHTRSSADPNDHFGHRQLARQRKHVRQVVVVSPGLWPGLDV